MKKIISILTLSVVGLLSSCKTSVIFSSSEKDAQIFVNGRQMGSGQTSIVKIKKHRCVNVKVEKTGFLTENLSYCFNGMTVGQAKTKYIELPNDDAYDASVITDYANKDFEVNVNKSFSKGFR